ncbi:hypothetical protein M885DRAFT_625848 [Pelagophyceae sp. CCMP2097]|nr:hypothetical protein M885DRAFT_625848 [Pelagophyceae sp. CCMP2097]
MPALASAMKQFELAGSWPEILGMSDDAFKAAGPYLQEQRINTRSIKLVDSLVRLHSNVINERRLDVVCDGVVQWDVDCCIPEPPREEPRSRHAGESESDGEAADAPRSVFVDETEDADEDLFGDPDADLDVQDDSDDEPAEPEAVVVDDDDDIAGDA